jgi:hypothetical protein
VSFAELSLLGMTCSRTAVRVLPLRWPRRRLANAGGGGYERFTYADVGRRLQGDTDATDNLQQLERQHRATPAGAVEAAIFVQPLCGDGNVACALAAENFFPWTFSLRLMPLRLAVGATPSFQGPPLLRPRSSPPPNWFILFTFPLRPGYDRVVIEASGRPGVLPATANSSPFDLSIEEKNMPLEAGVFTIVKFNPLTVQYEHVRRVNPKGIHKWLMNIVPTVGAIVHMRLNFQLTLDHVQLTGKEYHIND